ncbi:ATP-binding response regulator [Ramlibacter albus]|uniref:histidine kinase n=1 Tax=Ramlibacter albus TaxID=2079448 RepID=A0A923S2T7_9BURK|nr:hybrid sensor histidine kinase/response regulator [Ramlibacter albus]MBC5765696.1 hybrid sensor histidine kinase/response regulator [Ramlibacter albus]
MSQPAAASASTEGANPAAQAFVMDEFLRLGAVVQWRSALGIVVGASVLAVIAWPYVPAWLAAGWVVAVVGTQLAIRRVILALADPASGDWQLRVRKRLGISVLHGSVLALFLAAFPALDVAERAFATIVLIACATGSISTSAGYRGSIVAYGGPIMVPLLVLWAVLPNTHARPLIGVGSAILVVLYALMLLGFGKSTWQTFRESCLIRFREQELVAQLQEALADAERANKSKTRFLASASHDLRQPLHAVMVLASALEMRPLDERSARMVGMLSEVAQALGEQLDSLLDVSKLDAGVVDVRPQAVPAAALVRRHFAEVEPLIRARGLDARLDVSSEANVLVDEQLLRRVLRNLTDNALKFTPQGSIAIAVRDVGDDVEIRVSDTGIGIPEQLHEEVFVEFFQAGNPERDRSKGLGLGLSIVRRLCEVLGVRLRLESAPGAGTTFRLVLARTAAPPALPAQPRADTQDRFDLHVLLVDDEAAVRTSMRMLLEEMGCRCSEASSSEEAAAAAASDPPDLVLADFRLRGDDSGLRVFERVEAVAGPTPGVLVSGDTAPERLLKARNAGRKLLHKPLPAAALRELLAATA